MKEFLLLLRGNPSDNAHLSPEQIQAQLKRWRDWIGQIAATGNMLGAQPLENSGKVMRGPSKKITDGPFMEGKEVLGGYVLLKAKSIDDAIKTGEGCPILEAEGGTVEVREIGVMG